MQEEDGKHQPQEQQQRRQKQQRPKRQRRRRRNISGFTILLSVVGFQTTIFLFYSSSDSLLMTTESTTMVTKTTTDTTISSKSPLHHTPRKKIIFPPSSSSSKRRGGGGEGSLSSTTTTTTEGSSFFTRIWSSFESLSNNIFASLFGDTTTTDININNKSFKQRQQSSSQSNNADPMFSVGRAPNITEVIQFLSLSIGYPKTFGPLQRHSIPNNLHPSIATTTTTKAATSTSPMIRYSQNKRNDTIITKIYHIPSKDDPNYNRDIDIDATLSVMQEMGVNREEIVRNQTMFDSIPPWSSIYENFGSNAIILGLERCQAYRDAVSPIDRKIGPAGLFSTGTNVLHNLLIANCLPPAIVSKEKKNMYRELYRVNRWQVPWGKHNPEAVRMYHAAPKHEHVNQTSVLPIVTVRHPYTWMKALCKHPYSLRWGHNRQQCQQSLGLHRPVEGVYGDPLKNAPHAIHHYQSLLHVWTDWNLDYYQQNQYPLLMVRLEDIVYRPKQVVSSICSCIGGTLRGSDDVEEYFHDKYKDGNELKQKKKTTASTTTKAASAIHRLFDSESESEEESEDDFNYFEYQTDSANEGDGHGRDRNDLIGAFQNFGKPIRNIQNVMFSDRDWEIIEQTFSLSQQNQDEQQRRQEQKEGRRHQQERGNNTTPTYSLPPMKVFSSTDILALHEMMNKLGYKLYLQPEERLNDEFVTVMKETNEDAEDDRENNYIELIVTMNVNETMMNMKEVEDEGEEGNDDDS